MGTRRQPWERSGSVAVLALGLMIVMLGLMAFAIDIGYLLHVDTELQRAADASAIAATWRLLEQRNSPTLSGTAALEAVRDTANQFAQLNEVANTPVSLASDDVVLGAMAYPFSIGSTVDPFSSEPFNAVKVRVRKTSGQNDPVSLFFGKIFGAQSCERTREATAAFVDRVAGFRVPADGRNLELLPFALDKQTWDGLLAGTGTDNYTWDDDGKCVRAGADGLREASLYPEGTGCPGNRGTVDIGSSNNSTCDISRQIRAGVSAADLAYHGGKLELNAEGKLYLNGDTGISAGVKDDLASIIGKPRIVPVFSQVTGPGNNAQYTIVGFGGIRIMYVKLTGSPSSKKVVIQPARVVSRGAIPCSAGGTSNMIFSGVWLVR